MGRKYPNKDRHHIIPKARGGSNDPKNLITMRVSEHIGLHQLFDIDLPHEQILKLIELYDTAILNGFRDDLLDVLANHKGKYYDDDVFKK